MRRPAVVVMLLSVLAFLATACGGGNSDRKANQAYAHGVCTAIGTWKSEVESLATVPSGGITKASIEAKLNQFETATKSLVSEIKAVPAPNTSEGKTAKTQIDALMNQVQSTKAAVQSAASKLPAHPTVAQIASQLSTLVPQFQALKNSAQSTVKTIENAGGSLADAFKSERACKQLG